MHSRALSEMDFSKSFERELASAPIIRITYRAVYFREILLLNLRPLNYSSKLIDNCILEVNKDYYKIGSALSQSDNIFMKSYRGE